MTGPALSDRLAELGPAPCDGCRFAERCAAEKLACDAYAVYVVGRPEATWRRAPRMPTLDRYQSIFEQAPTTRRPHGRRSAQAAKDRATVTRLARQDRARASAFIDRVARGDPARAARLLAEMGRTVAKWEAH